jgi:hypothetical protein
MRNGELGNDLTKRFQASPPLRGFINDGTIQDESFLTSSNV